MKGRDLLVGIDLGTTVLKVAAFETGSGARRAQAAVALKTRVLPGGGREQRMPGIERAFARAVGVLRAELGGAWGAVRGVGVAAQGGSSIIADRATGEALTPMVLWNDARGAEETRRIQASKPPAYWRRHLLRDGAPMGLGRIRWMQARHPGLFQEGNLHVGAGEYLFHRLTGTWRQDAGNAIQAGSYNAARGRLSPHPFALSGLGLDFVAPLRRGNETSPLSPAAARRLGLAAGIPVAGPYIDQEAAWLDAAALSPRVLQCSLGTAWVANFALGEETPVWSPLQLVLPCPAGAGRLVVLPLLAGNLAWDWALRNAFGAADEAALARAEAAFRRQLLPPRGLLAFPWFTLSSDVCPGVQGMGGVLGLSPDATAEDLLRAVAFGLMAEFSRCAGALLEHGAVDAVALDGGAAKSAGFRAIAAALFAPLPVYHLDDGGSAAARGAVRALDPEAGRPGASRVRPPAKVVLEAARAQRNDYLDTVKRLWDNCPGGEPLVFLNG